MRINELGWDLLGADFGADLHPCCFEWYSEGSPSLSSCCRQQPAIAQYFKMRINNDLKLLAGVPATLALGHRVDCHLVLAPWLEPPEF